MMELGGSEEASDSPPEKQIFIISGQSNMSGRGGVVAMNMIRKWDGIVPPECRPNNTQILRLNAQLQWEDAGEPLHADIDAAKTCGVGPGMAFANAFIARQQGAVVGLVPCAVGDTAIREWEREGLLYDNMVQRVKASLEEGGGIKALLWYQGESDTLSQEAAVSYKDNMEKLICDFRSDLQLPSLPVIQVAIASGDPAFIDKVREAQLGINLPNVYCVDAKGLPLMEDNMHLNAEAQVKLDQMNEEHKKGLSGCAPCPDLGCTRRSEPFNYVVPLIMKSNGLHHGV